MSNENLEAIKDLFFFLDENFDALRASASPDQKPQLTAARDAARDAFWAASDSILADNNSIVVQTREQLQRAKRDIEDMIEQMESFSEVLNKIKEAVQFAGALVSLAAI